MFTVFIAYLVKVIEDGKNKKVLSIGCALEGWFLLLFFAELLDTWVSLVRFLVGGGDIPKDCKKASP